MKIEILRFINFSLNIEGVLILLVIIICLITGENKKNKSNALFIGGLISCIVYMLSEAFAWLFKGNSDLIWLLYIINDFVYLSGYSILLTFTLYLLDHLSKEKNLSKIIIPLMSMLSGAGVLLIIINHFNGMIFTIDASGYYQRGGLILLSQIHVIIGILIDTWIILKYRRSLGKNRIIIMLSYTFMPIVAITLQLLFYGIPVQSANFLLFSVMIFAGIQSQQAKHLKEKELENVKHKNALMLSQIQPHFISNVLLSIKYLCMTEPDSAVKSIDIFARYLRNQLQAIDNNNPISFVEELDYVKTYLFLEKMRYKDSLRIEYDIQSVSFCVPSLAVQPLVENAVRHGISLKETGGTLKISTRETENEYVIIIEDDGVGFDTAKELTDNKAHVGINNVRQRLAIQCGGDLSFQSEIGKGTTVAIKIKK